MNPAKPRIHFGHPKNSFNTPIEMFCLGKISRQFREATICNPNSHEYHRMEALWKQKQRDIRGYYRAMVLPLCDAGIFLPFRDGPWDATLYEDALFLAQQKKQIWEITHEGKISLIQNLSQKIKLSFVDTKNRLTRRDGGIIPY